MLEKLEAVNRWERVRIFTGVPGGEIALIDCASLGFVVRYVRGFSGYSGALKRVGF